MKAFLEWLRYIRHFAFEDLRKQHARSSLGYFWIVLSQFVNIAGIAFVWGILFKQDIREFFPYISAGVIVWNFISGSFNESTRAFVSNAPIIQNFRFPAWVFLAQMVIRYGIVLMYATAAHLIVFLLCGKTLAWAHLLIVPTYLTAILLMMQVGILLAYIGARFRDFPPACGNLVYLFFLVTPIIWKAKSLPAEYWYLIAFNPFAHLIDFMRPPLLGEVPTFANLYVIASMLAVTFVLQLLVSRRYEKHLVYWA
jgi:lipopolysaccharide transport system permease protein